MPPLTKKNTQATDATTQRVSIAGDTNDCTTLDADDASAMSFNGMANPNIGFT